MAYRIFSPVAQSESTGVSSRIIRGLTSGAKMADDEADVRRMNLVSPNDFHLRRAARQRNLKRYFFSRMNPYDPFNELAPQNINAATNFTLRELEGTDRRLQELKDGVLRALDHAYRANHDLGFDGEMASGALPTQEFTEGVDAKRPFDSVIESQEALSRRMQEVITPQPDLIFRDPAPPTFRDPLKWLSYLQIPIKPIGKLPKFTLPAFPESRTLAELQQMSDDEIQAFLGGNVSSNTVQMALHVLEKRHPHWSLTWTFWWVVLSVIVMIGIALMTH